MCCKSRFTVAQMIAGVVTIARWTASVEFVVVGGRGPRGSQLTRTCQHEFERTCRRHKLGRFLRSRSLTSARRLWYRFFGSFWRDTRSRRFLCSAGRARFARSSIRL